MKHVLYQAKSSAYLVHLIVDEDALSEALKIRSAVDVGQTSANEAAMEALLALGPHEAGVCVQHLVDLANVAIPWHCIIGWRLLGAGVCFAFAARYSVATVRHRFLDIILDGQDVVAIVH